MAMAIKSPSIQKSQWDLSFFGQNHLSGNTVGSKLLTQERKIFLS